MPNFVVCVLLRRNFILKREQVDILEKLIGQLESLHTELSTLSKKSPNDAVNTFKLTFINATLKACNSLLGPKYKPFDNFDEFNADDVPSNSDITFMLSQYMQAMEKLRADNIKLSYDKWYYKLEGSDESIRTSPPAKLRKK